MHPNEAFRSLGPLSLLIVLGALGLMLKAGGTDIRNSLSEHAATRRRSYVVFAAALISGGTLFYLFATKWLEPVLHLGLAFNLTLALTIICELIAAIIPDGGGTRSLVHRIFAWSMAVGMLVLTLILWSAHAWSVGKVLVTVFLAYMILGWYLFLFIKASRRFFLLFQSSYILSFYLAALAVAYIK